MNFKIKALEYHLVDHCNLNCAGCTHFSPLSKPKFADIDKFEKNLFQFKQIFKEFNIQNINLLGGEPLLHPQITEFIKITRSYFPLSKINVKTNGILLNTMQDSFYESCKKYKINLCISNYLNIEISKRKDILYTIEDKNKFFFNYISEKLNNNSKCNSPINTYHYCCSQLNENGNFHFCGYSANIHFYNKFYNYSIPVIKDKDYINIYETDFKTSDILKTYYSKRPFCFHCTDHIINDWHLYNGINEWKNDF